jgi:hypothetical protein
MNDLNENTLNPNCFEKTKEAWGIFSFFLPQMLKRRTSALLPITDGYWRSCRTESLIEKQKLKLWTKV